MYMGEALFEVKNFSVTLNHIPIISDLSFKVEECEFLTVLGPNGSGKSVLLKSLLGLLPHEGGLTWRAKPKIGYLPQGLNQASVRDLPLSVADFFALKRVRRAHVPALLAQVGLGEELLTARAGYLSGGEFQRMLVAWVLASDPTILFLDEPTTAVDAAGGETIYSLLNEIWRKRNLTVLNVTHDLNIVYAHSTHVLCLSRFGRRCFGAPREILTPAVLRDLYGAEVKFYTHEGKDAE